MLLFEQDKIGQIANFGSELQFAERLCSWALGHQQSALSGESDRLYFSDYAANNKLTFKGVTLFGKAEWPSLGFLQVKDNDFEPTKEMENV